MRRHGEAAGRCAPLSIRSAALRRNKDERTFVFSALNDDKCRVTRPTLWRATADRISPFYDNNRKDVGFMIPTIICVELQLLKQMICKEDES